MRFLNLHTERVAFAHEFTIAEKTCARNEIVFASGVIKPMSPVFFVITKRSPIEFRKASVGFTAIDPRSFDLTRNAEDFAEMKSGQYAPISTGQHGATYVHHIHMDSKGSVFYGVNGVLDKMYEGLKRGTGYYAFFLLGSLNEIELKENNVLPSNIIAKYLKSLDQEQDALKTMTSMIPGLMKSRMMNSVILGQNEEPKFHRVSNAMFISNDNKVIMPEDLKYNVAFSSRPIYDGEFWSFNGDVGGRLRIGITKKQPSNYTQTNLREHFNAETFGCADSDFVGQLNYTNGVSVQMARVGARFLVAIDDDVKGAKAISEKGNLWVVFRFLSKGKISVVNEEPAAPESMSAIRAQAEKPTAQKNVTKEPVRQKQQQHQAPHQPTQIEIMKEIADVMKGLGPPANKRQADVTKDKKVMVVTPSEEDIRKGKKTAQQVEKERALKQEQKRSDDVVLNDSFLRFPESHLKREKELGNGAQGEVALVSVNLFPGKMAAKRFKTDNKGFAKYEKRELNLMGKLSAHPAVVRTLGFIHKDNDPNAIIGYLMEFMENGSLFQAIHKTRLRYEPRHIMNWLLHASSGLHFLHKSNVLHRDIKPMNLLLSNDYSILKICDMGLAGEMQNGQFLNQLTLQIGTILYMAPEVLKETSRGSYDGKCDVYGMIIVLWEMIHKTLPYSENYKSVNMAKFVKQVIDGTLRPTMGSDIDSDLKKFIVKGWSSNASERPTMEEVYNFAKVRLSRERGDLKIRLN